MKKILAAGLLVALFLGSAVSPAFAVDNRTTLKPLGEKEQYENRRGRGNHGGRRGGRGWNFGFSYGPPPPPPRPYYSPYYRPHYYGPQYYYAPAPGYQYNPGVVVVPSPPVYYYP